jgi:hypothetical protein
MAATKGDITPTVETKENTFEESSPTHMHSQQTATKQMILFSAFIALAGWIFNFDLGMAILSMI